MPNFRMPVCRTLARISPASKTAKFKFIAIAPQLPSLGYSWQYRQISMHVLRDWVFFFFLSSRNLKSQWKTHRSTKINSVPTIPAILPTNYCEEPYQRQALSIQDPRIRFFTLHPQIDRALLFVATNSHEIETPHTRFLVAGRNRDVQRVELGYSLTLTEEES